MMIIHINEDGSTSVQTARYMASYDKEGVRTGVIGFTESAPNSITLHNAFKSKAEKEQLRKSYDAGMTLAVDKGVTADGFKVFDVAGKVYVKETSASQMITKDNANAIIDNVMKLYDAKGVTRAIISSLQSIKTSHDDHIRQIVREELRQFVARESERGGLFSKW